MRRKLSGGLLEVEAGLMRMQVTTDDVEEVLPAAPESTRLPKNVSYEPGPRWDVTYREINVIGKRAEEAREEVDKFLDTASMASVDRVRIVHGHGMGILKQSDRRIAGDQSARRKVLSSHARRRRNGRYGGGVKIELCGSSARSPLKISNGSRTSSRSITSWWTENWWTCRAIHLLTIASRDLLIACFRYYVKNRKLGTVLSEQEYDFGGNAHGPDVIFLRSERRLTL